MKAEIIVVGTVEEIDGRLQPQGWSFDCHNRFAAISIEEDSTVLYGGYTVEELYEIARVHLAS